MNDEQVRLLEKALTEPAWKVKQTELEVRLHVLERRCQELEQLVLSMQKQLAEIRQGQLVS